MYSVHSDVLITRQELDCLQTDSYVDVSMPVFLRPPQLEAQVENDPTRAKGLLQLSGRKKILACAEESGILNSKFIELIRKNMT